MIASAFHAWERRLASVDQNRIVRPFEWGLDWIGLDAAAPDPAAAMKRYSAGAMSATDEFYTAPRLQTATFDGSRLEFESAVQSPHAENNRVTLRVFPGRLVMAHGRRARSLCFRSGTPTRAAMSACVRASHTSASPRSVWCCRITSAAGHPTFCAPTTS